MVILDEAHNIEDSARSAASWEVTQEDVQVYFDQTRFNLEEFILKARLIA